MSLAKGTVRAQTTQEGGWVRGEQLGSQGGRSKQGRPRGGVRKTTAVTTAGSIRDGSSSQLAYLPDPTARSTAVRNSEPLCGHRRHPDGNTRGSVTNSKMLFKEKLKPPTGKEGILPHVEEEQDPGSPPGLVAPSAGGYNSSLGHSYSSSP